MGLFSYTSMVKMTTFQRTSLIIKKTKLNRQENSPSATCLAKTSQVYHFCQTKPSPNRQPNRCLRVPVVHCDYKWTLTLLTC